MASVKGITVEIAGNSSNLVAALKEADKALASTTSALKTVDKALKFDPSNVELLTQKQELLGSAVEETGARLEVLKDAAELAKQKLEEGTLTKEAYAQLTAEVAATEYQMKSLSGQAEEVSNALNGVGQEAEEAGDQAEDSGEKAEEAGEGWDAFGAVAQGVAQAITNYVIDALRQASEALIDFTQQAVESYGNFEQLSGGIEKLFGDASDAVMENASNAFESAGISANQYMETVTSFSASLIESLGGDTELAAQVADMALRDMSDNANTFGRDINDIMTVYQGLARGTFTTLDNLSLGFAGTKEGMIELINASGILRTEGGVFTRQIEDLDEVTFAQMIEAIHAVQEQLNITGTTANEAASTIEGSLNMTSAAWENLVAGMGNSEADIDTLINNFVDSAITAANNIIPVVETVFSNLTTVVGQIAPLIEELVPTLINGVLPTLLSSLTTLIVTVVHELPGLLSILTAAIPSLLNELIPAILLVLPDIIDAGLKIVIALANSLASNAPLLIPMAVQAVNQIVATLVDNTDELLLAGIQLIIGLGAGLIAAIPDLIDQVPTITESLVSAFNDFIPELVESATTWGADLIANFIAGITSGISNLVGTVSNVASTVASYLHFSVPDKGPLSDFDESGGDMIDVFTQGMLDELGTLESALNTTGEVISNGMEGSPDYTPMFNTLNSSIGALGSQPMVVNVSIGDEQIQSFILNSNRRYDYVSGGY